MAIRPASFPDLKHIAGIVNRAFWNDALIGDIILANRHQYPEDANRYWYHKLQLDMYDYTTRQMVATIPADNRADPKAEKIVGLASWYHIGDDSGNKRDSSVGWSGRAWRAPLWCAIQLSVRVENWIWPNRCHHPQAPDICDRAVDEHLSEIFAGPRSESWLLGIVAVDPDFQGQGIGRALIEDGLKMVDADGLPASLVSVKGTEGFYESCGFTERVMKLGGKGELEGYDGGWVMFRPVKKST